MAKLLKPGARINTKQASRGHQERPPKAALLGGGVWGHAAQGKIFEFMYSEVDSKAI